MLWLRGLFSDAGSSTCVNFFPSQVRTTRTLARVGWRRPALPLQAARCIGYRVAVCMAACLLATPHVSGDTPAMPSFKLIGRTVTQDQGAWVVDYRLRHVGKTGIIVTPEEIGIRVEGWVSNSRIASHALPRWSLLTSTRATELSAVFDVIPSVDESQRCRERLLTSIWAEEQASWSPSPPPPNAPATDVGSFPATGLVLTSGAAVTSLSLRPEAILHVRLRLDHQHMIFGDYDPLLAIRKIELTLGNSMVRDVVALDREQYLAQPKFSLPEPPQERRDSRHAITGPDSLHLEAHVPGHHYYRFPECPVRYSSKIRLRFWYLIATGTEGECRVRVTQTKDTPTSWRPLHNGDYEEMLKTVGRWTKVERIIQTESEATRLSVEFQIVGDTDVGEMWIDDVSVDPMGCAASAGP